MYTEKNLLEDLKKLRKDIETLGGYMDKMISNAKRRVLYECLDESSEFHARQVRHLKTNIALAEVS